MPFVQGGPAKPVSVVTGKQPTGVVAIPVYGYSVGALGNRKTLAGPAQPVVILTAADLSQNGGRYKLEGNVQPMPVVVAGAGVKVEGGPPIAVYPVNGWPPP